MSSSFRPDPLNFFRNDEPSLTNAGDGGLYFNGDLPRSRASEFDPSSDIPVGQSRWTGETGFLDAHRYELLERLIDQIMPSDRHSPGAVAARVPSWLDRIIGASPAKEQQDWQAGLDSIDAAAQATFGSPYVELPAPKQLALLKTIAANEFNATTPAEVFFKLLKHSVWDLYYRTEIGIHLELKFKGNGFNKRLK